MQQLKHKLKNRHLQMIALGAMIGTGLFFGSAKSIALTGPSIILSYLLGGVIMYIILRALGEMTVEHPNAGSFSEYAHTYLGHYAGFITGWSAWFEYTVVSMLEITAVTVFIDFFIPGLPHWILCAFILIFFTAVNLINIRLFGEFEFWFAGIKIVTIILMLLFSTYLIIFHHGTNPDIAQYIHLKWFFANGFHGFAISLVIVIFAFGGSEFISIAAGETENPKRNVPYAINGVIIRILLFYVLTMVVIILLYPYQKLSTNISPFVDVFKDIGFRTPANIMNFVAITAALSALNSCMYAASRMLFNLAANGHAPHYLSKVDATTGIPRRATLATAFAIVLTVGINYMWPDKAIFYLLTVVTVAILIVWFIILLTQLKFRKVHNKADLSYKLLWFPYSNIFAMIMLIFIMYEMTTIQDMRASFLAAPIWIAILTIFYVIRKQIYQKHE